MLETRGGRGTADDSALDTRDARRRRLDALNKKANDELAARCSNLRHPNDVILLAAADLVESGSW